MGIVTGILLIIGAAFHSWALICIAGCTLVIGGILKNPTHKGWGFSRSLLWKLFVLGNL